MMIPKDDHIALSHAIEAGDVPVVEALIRQHPELVNHPDWVPPPLHSAVLWNQSKVADLLLDYGADIEMRDPDQQTTPLRYAIMFCKTELIPLLLSRGANPQAITENGTTALQLAKECARGVYEDFDDLPPRDAYDDVIAVLLQAGITE